MAFLIWLLTLVIDHQSTYVSSAQVKHELAQATVQQARVAEISDAVMWWTISSVSFSFLASMSAESIQDAKTVEDAKSRASGTMWLSFASGASLAFAWGNQIAYDRENADLSMRLSRAIAMTNARLDLNE